MGKVLPKGYIKNLPTGACVVIEMHMGVYSPKVKERLAKVVEVSGEEYKILKLVDEKKISEECREILPIRIVCPAGALGIVQKAVTIAGLRTHMPVVSTLTARPAVKAVVSAPGRE